MSKQTSKYKKLNRKAKIYKGTGLGIIGITTTGGFLAYQMMVDWKNFEQEISEFIVVHQDSIKLNLALAFPILIGIVVFLIIALKKNKEFFSDKLSLSVLITIMVLYLVYSVIEVTMAALIGAWVGIVLDEFIFSSIGNKYKKEAEEEYDSDLEEQREKRRIRARKKAREEELNGSV